MRSAHPALEAYFACLYYAALRPAEARHLRVKDCQLPDVGWGELVLLGSTPQASRARTDSRQANEDRQIKHRGLRDTRPVPASPELVEILRRHITTFPPSPDGRLFVTRVGRAGVPLAQPFPKPLALGTSYRVWDAARAATLSASEYASPLARRPYDSRHAAVSLWLTAGVLPTQVAEWAGHSVNVLLRVYAKCVYGQDDASWKRIDAALLSALAETPVAWHLEPGGLKGPTRNFRAHYRRTAVDGRFWPITAGNHERAPDLRFRRSRALSARGGR